MKPPPPLPPLHPERPPLAYATPARTERRRLFDWGTCAWSAGVLFVWALLVIMLVPKVEQVFNDFKAKLPAPTQFMFEMERVLRAGFWVVVVLVPVGIGFATGPLGPGGRRLVRMLLTLAFAGLVVFALLSLLVPMINLMNGLSGARGR